MRLTSIVMATMLSACGATAPTVPTVPDQGALVRAACTPFHAPPDDTFGATTATMVEWARTYAACREALGLKSHEEHK